MPRTSMERLLAKISRRSETPAYIYDAETIKARCRTLRKNFPGVNLYYACKANTNPDIIKIIFKEGFGVEAVSPGEVAVARAAGVPTSKITFTCGSIDEEELVSVVRQRIRVHLDSLHQVEIFGKHFPGQEISVRLNLMVGAGHHSHVVTGGPDSKFGIDISQIKQLKILANKHGLRIVGLHQHIGSNILSVPMLVKAIRTLFNTALLFPELKYLDLGGGFGVPYKSGDKPLDMRTFSAEVNKAYLNFKKAYQKDVRISFEPGRYLVAEAGVLLVKVTDKKHNPTKTFVGVNSGMSHLLRPALYGSYHKIVNISRPKGPKSRVTVAGNICESGDLLAKDCIITKPEIGDILAIKDTGAYGFAMSSNYNSRPRPREFLIAGKKIKRI